ncbi:MAG: hypothetical protein ACR2PK_11875 [Acidimicrobiales bacterium]
MRPARFDPVQLSTDESPTGHPFADVRLYHSDLALLNYLLQDLRVLARRAAKGELVLTAFEPVLWKVHDLKRRTVVCDPERLLQPANFRMVGFFGDRRDEAGKLLDETELDVIGEFPSYPGILSYSSVELVNNQWANLVVHLQSTDREEWRHSDVHISAAEELAPQAYHNVRIHNGCIRGGVIGSETVVIEMTKYWDYDTPDLWHAERVLPGGATGTIGSPWSDLA